MLTADSISKIEKMNLQTGGRSRLPRSAGPSVFDLLRKHQFGLLPYVGGWYVYCQVSSARGHGKTPEEAITMALKPAKKKSVKKPKPKPRRKK